MSKTGEEEEEGRGKVGKQSDPKRCNASDKATNQAGHMPRLITAATPVKLSIHTYTVYSDNVFHCRACES